MNLNGKVIVARQGQIVTLMLEVAQGRLEVDDIAMWLREHAKDNQKGDPIE